MSYVRPLVYEESDSSHSGENWFLYWKISPSLWQEKLKKIANDNLRMPIWVPLYWGFHHQTDAEIDFGENIPETDIFLLQEIANKNQINLIFILFLTPCPLFPRGGIPPFIDSTISLAEQGIALNATDSNGQVNKIYSFFEPKVFKSFCPFIDLLKKKAESHSFSLKIAGSESFFFFNGKIQSYLRDRSSLFESHFQKFIEIKKQENNSDLLRDPQQEEKLKREFEEIISNLYRKYAREKLKEYWQGDLKVGFLGGGPTDVFERSSDAWNYSSLYYPIFMEFLEKGYLPSAILLDSKVRLLGIDELQKSVIDINFIKSQLEEFSLYDVDKSDWLPLFSYILFESPNDDSHWLDLGLIPYLKKNFKFEIKILRDLSLFEEIHNTGNKIYFFQGDSLSETGLKTLLKIFMNGGRVILDKNGFSENVERQLSRFFIENKIVTQKIFYLTEIQSAKIGESELILFNSSELSKNSTVKKNSFWENLFDYFSMKRIFIFPDDDIYYHCKNRGTIAGEYNFQEIKRFYFWNPSSYKREVSIKFDPRFFILKGVSDNQNVELKDKDGSVELAFRPKGRIRIDFAFLADN